MKPGDLIEAKSFAIQLWDLEKQFMKVAPSSRDRNLLMDLVRLEDKPVDLRTGGEQWEIEQILEKLSEKPPYRKQTRPPLTNAIQPLRAPQTEVERAVQMDPHIRYGQASLENLLTTQFGARPGDEFVVVDGYGPMMARQREAAARKAILERVQAEALAKLNRPPNVFVRFGRWVKNFFAPAPRVMDNIEDPLLEMEHHIAKSKD